jgi:hypothetical protein
MEEYKRLLEAALEKEKDLKSIIRRLEAQVQELLSRRIATPRSHDAPANLVR